MPNPNIPSVTESIRSSTLNGTISMNKSSPSLAEAGSGELHIPRGPVEPTIPEDMQRTKLRPLVPKQQRNRQLEAGKLTGQLQRNEVAEWQHVVHPSGALYFHQWRPGLDILTDTDLGKTENLNSINEHVASLLSLARACQLSFDQVGPQGHEAQVSLVLELSQTDTQPPSCRYYFVDHAERLIFWLHVCTDHWVGSVLCGELPSVSEKSQIRNAITAQYWLHCERYANTIRLKVEYLHELREILIHANADAILSETSVIPFSRIDLEKMLDVVCKIQDADSDGNHHHSMSVVARMMRLFAHSRFINFSGLPWARLDADQSLYGTDRRPKSYLFVPFSLLLLCAPDKHLKVLQEIYVDRLINASRWAGFINNLKDEWTAFSVYSTVMLAVDISFLAVPNVISVAVSTAIYASTLSALGSLISSVLLLGQIRGLEIDSVKEGAAYMSSKTYSFFGAEILAIMLSLPYAFLVWGMITMGIALSIVIFSETVGIAKGIILTVWAIVLLLVCLPLALSANGDEKPVKSW
ncbi:hypothetical protein PAXINDRAFT_171244 [Paxillus involutus ATCC 200175]|uniref:Unplaced genomic scaffold PAXINscaffold_42, whole genome shotgun sequence n=1 Tax=Paxillus involutus ATCC 200175 TaxID=664439 RepID=A0A0C9TYS8_PAXIN|nr:hypothetical protein PAXINDRAFT_171244 [Paxillus involutus ATCC 200175]